MSGSTHRFLLPFSAACLFLFGVCGCQRPEAPSTVVTTELDKVCNTDGLISLREAISYAEEGDRITFGEEIPGGTIMELRHGSLKIKKGITVDAESNPWFKYGGITIDGRRKGRVFTVAVPPGGGRVELIGLTVTGGKESAGGGIFVDRCALTLTDMTVAGNFTEGSGGGIGVDRGVLSVVNSTIAGNYSQHYGGGIGVNQSDLTVVDSTVIGNSALWGGGISSYDNSASITNTRLVGNVARICGGGIYVTREATIAGSTVAENYAESGGGIYVRSHQNVTITDSTIARNSASKSGGGGILSEGKLSVAGSTISGNSANWRGGGICNWRNLSLAESTVANNSARFGGGVCSTERFAISNTTIGGNSAHTGGGIAALQGTFSITGSAVTDNSAERSGGGIYFSCGDITVTDTAVTDNSASVGGGVNNSDDGILTITGSKISGNSADRLGGGIVNAGQGTFADTAVVGNTSGGRGGGICNLKKNLIHTFSKTGTFGEEEDLSFDGRSILALTNVTVTGNSAEEAGGIDSYCEFELDNSIVALNTANGENGDIGGISGDRISGSNNLLGGDPLFTVPPVFEEGKPAGADAVDLSLKEGSPAIDTGTNDAVRTETDLAGNPRIANGTVDIGAFEFQGEPGAEEADQTAEETPQEPAAE